MNFNSLLFILFCVLAVVGLRLTPAGRTRKIVLFIVNAIFVASFFPGWLAAAPMLGFVLIGYGAVLITRSHKHTAVGICILALVALFVWLKHYSFTGFLPSLAFVFSTIGLSYILFRILHLVVDVSQGVLQPPRFLDYLNYLFFFLNFVSGPIQRYEDFSEQVESNPSELTRDQTHNTVGRIVLGYFKVVMVSSVTSLLLDAVRPQFYAALSGQNYALLIGSYVGAVVLYLIVLYANFSGYMDIVIGVGRLAGFVVPENFDRPFASKNFMDLWARWHMTLSAWFRVYVFGPLLKFLIEKTGARGNIAYLGAVAFFFTFLVMGIWHGATFPFVIYGLLLGFGVSFNRFWQIWAAHFLGKKAYKTLRGQGWYFQFSRALTISYFSVSLTCIWIDALHAYAMESLRGLTLAAAATAVLTVCGTCLGSLMSFGWRLAGRAATALYHIARNLQSLVAIVAAIVAMNLGTGIVLFSAAHAGAPISVTHLIASLVLLDIAMFGCAIASGALDGIVCNPVTPGGPTRALRLEAWMGLRVFILVILDVQLMTAVPEFIYRAF